MDLKNDKALRRIKLDTAKICIYSYMLQNQHQSSMKGKEEDKLQ